MTNYAEAIAELSPEKQELLQLLLREQASDHNSFPLSFAQQRLWFIDQLEPGSFLYNICTNVRIEGRLNLPAFQRSFNEIVRRHETLRTTFRLVAREPVQVIADPADVPITFVDLRESPVAEKQDAIQRLLLEEARLPFDLSRGPLLRVKLLGVAAEEHVLLVSMHHIISDGWSLAVFVRELAALYQSFSNEQPSTLAELPVQYTDFVLWQREFLQGEVLAEHLEYWKKQLAGAPPVLELPADRPRPAINTYRGAKQPLVLSNELSAAVRNLSEAEGATLFMTLVAAFQTLLYRYTGQDDIVIGTPIANRNRAETEGLIGFFVNTLLLRTSFAGNPSFQELLRRVREVALGAYAHQDLPFEKLVEELQPERSLSNSPLFQVAFFFQNAVLTTLELSGLRLTPLPGDNGTAKFDLTLTMEDTDRGLVGVVEYNTDLFDAATIQRMIGHYETLLQGIVNHPEHSINELPLLTSAEQRQLMEWNATDAAFAAGAIHESFESQVRRTPASVAVVFEKQQLTYAELNERANQLAHHLRSLGVTAEARVGVMLERSPSMVIGLLAVLKAGGAYVPLDPHYPRQRVLFMLENARVHVLLTDSELAATVSECDVPVVCLDGDQEPIAAASSENPGVMVQPENLAYVIYTSGSTGTPKGVQITHQAVMNFLSFMERQLRVTEHDVLLAVTSLSFDIAVLELFLPLTTGARVVLLTREQTMDAAALSEQLSSNRVSLMQATPTTWRMLTEYGWRPPERLKILCGGEALSWELAQQLGNKGNEFWNLYGPTETTVWSLTKRIEPHEKRVTIGRPMANTQVYVLDRRLHPVPLGVPGELYLGGDGLARGYLERPDLTAERFVANPFNVAAGERMYRTGDLVRYLTDGELEYLGRMDQQVKVRGFRIELGEIEAVLLSQTGVREAVVIVREDSKRLVAYVVLAEERQTPVTELRSTLKEKLPPYMIPSDFVVLKALPLTSNGKVNRRALPAPDDNARSKSDRVYVAPGTLTEKRLADVWAEALGIKQVGIHDNYFELGGDSLRSVGLLAVAKERGLHFSLQQLFQHQTIHELAREIDVAGTLDQPTLVQNRVPFSLLAEEDRLKLPPGLEDAYPLTMMQAGMLFHSEYSPASSVYHNVNSFLLRAPFDQQSLETTLRELITRHPVLRTSFDLINYSEPVQLVHSEVPLPLLVEDLRGLSHTQQQQVVADSFEAEKNLKFDWRQAPLFRIRAQRRSEETFQFTLTEHHAILDGWSVASLLSELFARYSELLNDQSQSADRGPVNCFRDFVELERLTLQSAESKNFWSELLRDSVLTTLPSLPTRDTAGNERVVEVPISSELSHGLKALAQSAGVPLKSVLLAAHLRVMRLLSGHEDVLTGVISHGRPEGVDGERAAGLFLNTLPFRQRLSGGTWVDLVREVFESELQMLPHRRYPLAQIQKEHGHSLLETFFNFVHLHVYDALKDSGSLEVLESRRFTDTNFAFAVEFSLELRSSDVKLVMSSGETSDFTSEQLRIIGDYFSNTLQAMVADPFARYESVCLLGTEERNQILERWNQTDSDLAAADRLLHQWFEIQTERTPNAVALTLGTQEVSYRELNQRANQLAHHLLSLGVGPEVRVGIMLARSPLMLVGLLAVLKSGGAYVPLDPNYPQERLAFMLTDAEVHVLLTEESLRMRIPQTQSKVLILDHEWPAHCSTNNPLCQVRNENLAYVIYTSGSTGTPKGVALTHRNASAFVSWAIDFFTPERLQAVLASTSISFDLSIFELFVPLSAGGCVVLAENALQVPSHSNVSLINTVPSAMAELVRQQAVPPSVRVVNLAGEALSRKLVQDLYAMRTVEEVINLYGPSEDTTYTTYEVLRDAPDDPVLIGCPISNTQIYLLDRDMQPVPTGVAGELYTSGEGLARGYLNRPALTAEKFIPNPYSKQPGTRLYRTGDLARYREDGRIEYLGRLDQQVKVRGFRIELGEIEAALENHPMVQQCALAVSEHESGDKRLVAYLVPREPGALNVNELRSHLKQRLPDYMVPQLFVLLSEMPLTPNGKVDRKRLPMAKQAGVATDEVFIAPRTQTEDMVAAIFADILRVERVGVKDDFFELGGDSLLATQVLSRLRAATQTEIQLRSLFNAPTAAQFAASLEDELRNQEGYALPPIEAVPRAGELPLSFAQERLWFMDQWAPGKAFYNIAEAVRLTGPLDVEALSDALNEIVGRHEALRTRFVAVEGRAVQVIAPSLTLPLQLVDLQMLPETAREAEVLAMVRQEAQRPFDLSQWPLLRATLLRLGEEEHVVLFTMHHIISDAWSIGIFVKEVAALYQAFSAGQPSALPELPVQYADFAHWQRTQLEGAALNAQVDYWKKRLAGAPSTLELPSNRPQRLEKDFATSKQTLELTASLVEALKRLSRQTGSTLFMTLLAAFQVLLRHHSGMEDVVVGTDVANRNRSEVENLIGFFINQLALRTDLSGDPSFTELLQRVREVTLGAYAHQDVPFDRLVEALKVERSLDHTPLFQVKFVYQNTPVPVLELPNLRVQPIENESGATRVNLQLTLWEARENLKGWLEYNAQLFDDTIISRLSSDFFIILDKIVVQPNIRLSELDQVLAAADRERRSETREVRSQKFRTIRRKAINPANQVQIQ